MDPLRQILQAVLPPRAEGANARPVRLPRGQRVYAIGDIHGRLDLFEAMIGAIEDDDRSAPPATSVVILLGDLIDRGPDSAGVISRVRSWQGQRKLRVLAGNHEEMFLKSFTDGVILRHFLRYGGRETLISYGIAPHTVDNAPIAQLQALMSTNVPQADRAFLAACEDMIEIGGYLFVHAGIDPEREPKDQDIGDLRWIREPFLSHDLPRSHMIVHGHTISEEIEERSNRIGIDTGAYRHGCLTTAIFEGNARRFIQAREQDGQIVVQAKGASR